MPTSSPTPPAPPPERDQSDTAGVLVGVVLAGGSSRRMGTDKALLEVDGERLLDRAARLLREAGASDVVVASGLPDRYDTDLPQLPDPAGHAGDGPLAGLAAAFAHFRAVGAGAVRPIALVLAVDLPDADPALLRLLAATVGDTGAPGAVPLDPSGRPQPLHAAYDVDRALPALTAALDRGERRVLRVVVDELGAILVDAPEAAGPWHRNLNTPDDLQPE